MVLSSTFLWSCLFPSVKVFKIVFEPKSEPLHRFLCSTRKLEPTAATSTILFKYSSNGLTFYFIFSGSMLLTADVLGNNFHVFHVLPHPICPSLSAIHHLYTLHRGDTTATVSLVSWLSYSVELRVNKVFLSF